MDYRMTVQELEGEMHTLIRLHQQGLYNSRGYLDRKRRMKEFIREHRVDLQAELDPITFVLYKRYFE